MLGTLLGIFLLISSALNKLTLSFGRMINTNLKGNFQLSEDSAIHNRAFTVVVQY